MWFTCQTSRQIYFLSQVGGYDGASRQCLSTVECYDPEKDSWCSVAEMSARRSGAGISHIYLFIYNLKIVMNIKYSPGNTIYCSLRFIESVLPTSGILTLAS